MPSQLFTALGAAKPGRLYFDLTNDRVIWDERSLEIFGLTRSEFVGTYAGWARLVHEDDLPGIERQVEQFLARDKELSLRYRIRKPDGEIRYVWAVAAIERDAQGKPITITGLHIDETEILRLEAASSLRLQVLNSIGEGVCVSRRDDGRIVFANPGLGRMVRQNHQQLVGCKVHGLLTDQHAAIEQRIEPVLRTAGSWLGELEFSRNDGSKFWASASITTLEHFEYGSLHVWIVHDLAQPQTRERAMVKDHDQLATIYNAIADAVFSVRMPARAIEYGNRAVTQMFGYQPDEYIGNPTRLFYPDDESYAGFGERLRQAFLAGEPQARAEVQLVTKDGRRFWTSIVTTFVTENGQLAQVISVVRDISKQKELEEQLLHAQKMEAIGELAGGVAHDMNNILAAILSVGSVVQEEMTSHDRWLVDVTQIVDAAERGKSLVENLLGFARKGAYAVRPLHLDHELREVIALLDHTKPKGIELAVDFSAPNTFVEGDRVQLTQTILNLCINAQDAIGKTGRIRLSTRTVVLERDASGALPAGEYYEIEVVDNGPGMSPEVLKRAFDPFFTTKPPGKGSGLGLSMAYGVMHRHRGTIDLESELGRGTKVRCLLPLCAAPARAPRAARVRTSTESLNLLVVDDEKMLRESTKRVLERLGHRVQVADGGRSALDLFGQQHRELDAVILDLSMPDMDGVECFRHLRAIDPTACVIIATGLWEAEDELDPQAEGVVLLKKPFGLDALRATLGQLKQKGSHPTSDAPADPTVEVINSSG